MKRIATLIALFPLLLSIAGCHTPQIIDTKARNIQRIAVALPTGSAAGLRAWVNASGDGAVPALLSEASANRAKTFNELVLKEFPQGVVYNDFTGEVITGLEKKGFKVVDATSRINSVEISDEKFGKFMVPAVSSDEADVILIPFTNFGYSASSFLASFRRHSFGQFGLVDTKTNKLVFADWLIYKAPDGKFEYATYQDLTTNIVPATEALRDVAKDVGKQIVNAVK